MVLLAAGGRVGLPIVWAVIGRLGLRERISVSIGREVEVEADVVAPAYMYRICIAE